MGDRRPHDRPVRAVSPVHAVYTTHFVVHVYFRYVIRLRVVVLLMLTSRKKERKKEKHTPRQIRIGRNNSKMRRRHHARTLSDCDARYRNMYNASLYWLIADRLTD